MNIIKKFIRKIQKKNPYIERQIENADIIIGENERLTREQRVKRFDEYYKQKFSKNWEKAHKKRTI
jgi:hypothetical protein